VRWRESVSIIEELGFICSAWALGCCFGRASFLWIPRDRGSEGRINMQL